MPRWAEAFPDSVVAKSGEALPCTPEQIWLQLSGRGDGAAAVMDAQQLLPGTIIIVLADMPDDEEGLAVFTAGARAYANTHSDPEILQHISDVVSQGGLWIGQSLMQRLLTATSQMARSANRPRHDWADVLSARELEVARAVANGASNKEIARQLDITERTVKAHVSAVLDKLKVRDRLQISLKINGMT